MTAPIRASLPTADDPWTAGDSVRSWHSIIDKYCTRHGIDLSKSAPMSKPREAYAIPPPYDIKDSVGPLPEEQEQVAQEFVRRLDGKAVRVVQYCTDGKGNCRNWYIRVYLVGLSKGSQRTICTHTSDRHLAERTRMRFIEIMGDLAQPMKYSTARK